MPALQKCEAGILMFSKLVFKFRNEVGAHTHCVQSDLHLAGLFIIHKSAELIIGNKTIIACTEGIKHCAVFKRELICKHYKCNSAADKERYFYVERTEHKDENGKEKSKEQAYSRGNMCIA